MLIERAHAAAVGVGLEAEALDWAETHLEALRERAANQWGGPLVTDARRTMLNASRFWSDTASGIAGNSPK